jgi:2-oxoisovalerate dehydrogenase E1 component
MPRVKRLQPGAEWNELSTTAADWKAADPGLLATMLGQLHLIRAFEETVLELAGEGLVHGPAHSSIGQEGGAVGSIVSLRSTDAVNGSHRGHHQFLAKALTHVTKGVLDLRQLVTPEVQEVLQRTLAEILGLAQGYCAGAAGPCTCSGSRPGRWAPTPSSAAACRWRPATPGRSGTRARPTSP